MRTLAQEVLERLDKANAQPAVDATPAAAATA
jgi:hypothetical protein